MNPEKIIELTLHGEHGDGVSHTGKTCPEQAALIVRMLKCHGWVIIHYDEQIEKGS